jgi:hypothetical protein
MAKGRPAASVTTGACGAALRRFGAVAAGADCRWRIGRRENSLEARKRRKPE